MFFEDCPKPLGCTILLRGAHGDELKKVKHVVQYGIFAAYHLALETSFLADEGATLPELPMNTPLTVALPEKPSSVERSISTIPGFSVSSNLKPQEPQASNKQLSKSVPSSDLISSNSPSHVQEKSPVSNNSSSPKQSLPPSINSISPVHLGQVTDPLRKSNVVNQPLKQKREFVSRLSLDVRIPVANRPFANGFGPLKAIAVTNNLQNYQLNNSEGVASSQDGKDNFERAGSLKEEFPPSPAEHQSILVNLSSRCVWKGTVCERSHLFRIKYYGSFDKPLGRFLRDHLFDQNYRCHSCDMPSEAHVHCYTHRQGSLTISVKKLPEILLPGEKEGKIWMWHRCLRCPRINGFPPATRRVIMSDAAW